MWRNSRRSGPWASLFPGPVSSGEEAVQDDPQPTLGGTGERSGGGFGASEAWPTSSPTFSPPLVESGGPVPVPVPLGVAWPVATPQAAALPWPVTPSVVVGGPRWMAAPSPAPSTAVTSLAAEPLLAAPTLPSSIVVTAWPDFAALPAVTVQAASTASAVVATDGNGMAVLDAAVSGPQSLEVTLAAGASARAQADAAVTLHDAVAILRLLGGRSASAGQVVSPSPWVTRAADFDGNGVVSVSDAIGVLRHAVGQPALRPSWVFFDRTSGAGMSLPASGGDAQAPVSQIDIDVEPGGVVSLVGVLRGDVDGSLAQGRFGLRSLGEAAWGIKPGFGEVSLSVGEGDLVLSVADGQAARLSLDGVGPLDLAGARVSIRNDTVDLSALGPDRSLSGVGALAVDSALRLGLAQWQQVLGDGAVLSGRGAVELLIHSPAQASALGQTLDDTRIDRTNRPALTVSVAVDAADPQAAQLMASIDETLRASLTTLSESLGFAVPVTLSSGQTLWPGPATLLVSVQDSVVSFGGSAAGVLYAQVDASGRATFSRASSYSAEIAVSDTVVTGLFAKTLIGVEALSVTLAPSDAAVQYAFNAPQATSIELTGATGGGADEIVIRIADPRLGTQDVRALHLDTSALASSGDTLTFRFDESARNVLSKPFDNDEVTLLPSSHVNDGFSRLKVVAGIVDASGIDPQAGGYFPPNKTWEVSSGVVLSLQQLQLTTAVVSPSNSGALLAAVSPDEQAQLEALLAEPGALGLSGLMAGERVDGALTDREWVFPPITDGPIEPYAQPLSGAWGQTWPGLVSPDTASFIA